jgi:hypothetical protein
MTVSLCSTVYWQIGDFGLARDLIDDSYYMIQGTKLPIRWTAIEVKGTV